MSLRKQFLTDPAAATEGVWVEFTGSPNPDKSIPGFKLARVSNQNKKYAAAISKLTASGAELEAATEKSTAELMELFVDTVVLDWRNFQPLEDGNALVYSRDNALMIMSDPAWFDLYTDLTAKAYNIETFRAKTLDTNVKN